MSNMMIAVQVLTVILIKTSLGVDYKPPIATLQPLCPRGLRIGIPDSPEISFVGYHVNVNSPLIGASPSEYSADLGRPVGGEWQYDLPDIYLKKGDQISYWMHMIHNGMSILTTDRTWTVPEMPCENVNITNYQCQTSITRTSKGPVCSGQLLFEEEFNNFNLDTWQHEISAAGGRHHEFQIFVNNRSNSFVRDGVLHLHPTLTADVFGEDFLYNGVLDLRSESCTRPFNNGCNKRAIGAQILNPIMSAHLQSSESFAFQYGVAKIRAKMPTGDWLWPSIGFLPLHNAYGEWPRSGEVVMVESRGNAVCSVDGEDLGFRRVEMSIKFGEESSTIKSHIYSESENTSWVSSFHEFQLEWTPDHIQFSVDNKAISIARPPTAGGFWTEKAESSSFSPRNDYGSKVAPFDQQFYITISLAVGGVSTFFPDKLMGVAHPKPWNNTSPTATLDFWEKKNEWYPSWEKGADFQIDYIRVWALP